MKNDYQEIIATVSTQIAKTFLSQENNLAARATLLDADIADITRQIGAETTKLVLEHVRDDLGKKTARRLRRPKTSRYLFQEHLWVERTPVAVCMEALCRRKTPQKCHEHHSSREK